MSLTNHHTFQMRFSGSVMAFGNCGLSEQLFSCLGLDVVHAPDKLQGGLCTACGWDRKDTLISVSSREPGEPLLFGGKK